MGTRDPRVDGYIEKAAPFAQPILTRLREAIHAGCPEAEETIRWGAPSFSHQGMLCNIAAFKAHCAVMFWKGPLIPGAEKRLGRIEKPADLPPRKQLVDFVRQAARLNEQGAKVPKAPKARKEPLHVPDAFASALRKSAKARAAFEKLSPSHQREYVEWVAGAKREETRDKRIATALEWIPHGKSLNWKYER